MSDCSDFRVVVGLDFGTTYSGFTCCHVSDEDFETNTQWPGELGQLKTNTVLQYNEHYKKIESWGYPALSKRPNKKGKGKGNKNEQKPIELFKLYLGKLPNDLKPKLPFDYKRAITGYLRKFGELIKETIEGHWDGIDPDSNSNNNNNKEEEEEEEEEIKDDDELDYVFFFLEKVLIIITVPAEYSEKDKGIMRECAYRAGLIKERESKNLQFTTEPEAAAIYCMEHNLKAHELDTPGTTFMIVDCGGGTVDLTTRKLFENKQLGEVTERAGDFCGSTFIDKEFLKALRRILGNRAIDLLIDKHYGQMQYMIQDFSRHAKLPFTGVKSEFSSYEMDIEDVVPVVMQYVTEEVEEKMEETDWLIEFGYKDIKSMFDPIVERIIDMIKMQLNNSRETCSAMFLVGGFSQSKYLQKRIKQEFHHQVKNISIPLFPIAAISRGAALYGLSMINSAPNLDRMNSLKFVINERKLKYTYGIRVCREWKDDDLVKRKRPNGRTYKFRSMAQRGTPVKVNQEFTLDIMPEHAAQNTITFYIYYTTKYKAQYCDEDEMEKLGSLIISLPDVHLGKNRPVLFGLTFGQMEITATAKNKRNGQNYQTTLELDI
ncbi:actin-like ATPase domain-containing protein [Rhizophagus irregularis]|uniref:Actin-like ATPase domain-containing protein n=1 Tax=Rhizophagus irregularis TaxID=588596 RepID=A0A2N0PZF9_9GLOM|nr:actin-like ATPase domain-containing protein [Rhizophagus irregularis]